MISVIKSEEGLSLNQILLDYIESRRPSNPLALRIHSALNTKDADWMARCILLLSPSANALTRILKLADEIAGRDRLSVADVFELPEIKAALADTGGDRNSRYHNLYRALEELRFPELSRIRNRILELRQAATTLSGAEVHLPENLEGDTVELTLKIRRPSDAEMACNRLQSLATSSELYELLELLNGTTSLETQAKQIGSK